MHGTRTDDLRVGPNATHDPHQVALVRVQRAGHHPTYCIPEALETVVGADAVTRVDLRTPFPGDLHTVARQLGLPYRAVDAVRSPATRPWCVTYHDCVAVRVLLTSRDDPGAGIQVRTLDLIARDDLVLTVHSGPVPALERAWSRVLARRCDAGGTAHEMVATTLLDDILAGVVSSHEALAHWIDREGTALPTPCRTRYSWTAMADAMRVMHAAATLRQVADAHAAMLARAADTRPEGTTLPALPAAHACAARWRRIGAELGATEATASALLHTATGGEPWDRATTGTSRGRLNAALLVPAGLGLAWLALHRAPSPPPWWVAPALLVGFVIGGLGLRAAGRAAQTTRAMRATWGKWEDMSDG